MLDSEKNSKAFASAVVASSEWMDVVAFRSVELGYGVGGKEPYYYLNAKKETVVAIVWDSLAQQFVLKNEGTLSTNFIPSPKFMTETIENKESPEEALFRGLEEEFGLSQDAFYLLGLERPEFFFIGEFSGTCNEKHYFYFYVVDVPGFVDSFNNNFSDFTFAGDGSVGEFQSSIICMPAVDAFKTCKDWLFHYGLGKLYVKSNVDDDLVLFLQSISFV